MRNKLDSTPPVIGSLSGLIYSATGDLEHHHAAVNAYNHGEMCLTFGPMRINMSAEAATELAKHLNAAVAAITAKE